MTAPIPDDVWVIIPIKSLSHAKRRLASKLSKPERAALMMGLLDNILDIVSRLIPPARVLVISHDRQALKRAAEQGARPVHQSSYGLNAAVEEGIQAAEAAGAKAVLILAADLPFLQYNDVEELLGRSNGGREVIIAPGQRGGTHAILLRPLHLFRVAFGPNSFIRHLKRANQAGARLDIVENSRWAFDLDTHEDLEAALRIRPALLQPNREYSDHTPRR